MGVQNLWVLLAPVGRQVEIESLAGEVLAVDASIWLTQFVKAMRDDEGNMIRNAHLVGTFHRVAKLLFYGVRPVFVFDGDTPEIKKRTTARRRRQRESQASNLRQTAQRILINRLKLYREELKKNGGTAAPAIDPNFFIPEMSPLGTGPVSDHTAASKEMIGAEQEEKDSAENTAPSAVAVAGASSVLEDDTASAESGEELTIDDIDLDTSELSKIDLHAVFSLPPHLQKDMVQKILRDRRQEVRDKFIPLAGQPEAYSHVQISSFLGTVKLNRRIEAARMEKTQEELQAEEKTSDPTSGDGSGYVIGHGKRIASNSSKFFIYEKASDKKPDDHLHNGPKAGRRTHTIDDTADASGNDSNSERELMADIDETAEAEATAAGMETYGLSLDERFMPNKRRRHMRQGPDPGKMSLSDFSIKDFVAQTEHKLHQQQEVAWDVDGARSAWLARHHLKAKHEPELAIEKARRARLGLGDRDAADSNASQSPSASGKSGSSGKTSDSKSLSRAENAASASIFSGSAWKKDASGDDHSSAESPSVVTESIVNSSVEDKESGQRPVVVIEGGDDDDDEIEWEDVKDTEAESGVVDTASAQIQQTETHERDTATVENSATLVREETAFEHGRPNQRTEQDESRPESIEVSDFETDEELGDDMMLTLKNEIEDAKAEEDLNLLKEEALHSAMVTASNLTQWAAGAVRRALEAHTRSNKKSPPPDSGDHPWTPAQSQSDGATREQAIVVAEEEEEKEEPPTVKSIPDEEAKPADAPSVEEEEKRDVPVMNEQHLPEATDISDEQLRKTLEDSQRGDATDSSSGNSRYLRYASPKATKEPDVLAPVAASMVDDETTVQSLEQEQRELKKLRNRQQRDVEGVNDEMVQDVMELLRLFGVPYLVCPMEAEAQCAMLEMLGLVSGIITDDSDIFPFGGKKVYKNIFHNQKFVEAFFAQDIQRELGFSREDVIALAMLLGSDYTDGVRGIGIVNATEVVNAFPGIEGLREFKKWVQSFDLTEEAERAASRTKKTDAELEAMTPRERFEYTHANARRKWELGEAFPNSNVVQAYLNPQVDKSEEHFSWNLPNLAGLREFCTRTFGWNQAKTDGELLPLMQRAAASTGAPGRGVQTRIDQFFRSYDDQVKFAKIKSKRLRSAVEGRITDRTEGGSSDLGVKDVVVMDDDANGNTGDTSATPSSLTGASTTSRFFTKKKASMSAMAGGRGKTPATSKRKSSAKK